MPSLDPAGAARHRPKAGTRSEPVGPQGGCDRSIAAWIDRRASRGLGLDAGLGVAILLDVDHAVRAVRIDDVEAPHPQDRAEAGFMAIAFDRFALPVPVADRN